MKKKLSFICFIILTALLLGYSEVNYGNNKTEILRYLNNSDNLTQIDKFNLSIMDPININNAKIVGFMSNTKHGVLVYEKDKNENFILKAYKSINIQEDYFNTSNFIIRYDNNNAYPNKASVVISNDTRISKLVLEINDKYEYTQLVDFDESQITLIKHDLPYEETQNQSFKYKYFDLNNNEIKNLEGL